MPAKVSPSIWMKRIMLILFSASIYMTFVLIPPNMRYSVTQKFSFNEANSKRYQATPSSKPARRVWSVFSTQCSLFHDWNSLVVVHAHERLAIQGPIVRLMSCRDESYVPMKITYHQYKVVRLPDHNPVNGDDFPRRNKGYGVQAWLLGEFDDLPHDDDVIVLMDPDQIYINHLNVSTVRRGHAIAGRYALSPDFFVKAKPYCQGACDNIPNPSDHLYGTPYCITAGDLRRLAPVWNNMTESFRSNPQLKSKLSEMYSYNVAAIKTNIVHKPMDLMLSNADEESEPWSLARWNAAMLQPLAFLHFDQRYYLGTLSWFKHDHSNIDPTKCDRSVLFSEASGEDLLLLQSIEGMPLKYPSDYELSREQIRKARSAFLFQQIVTISNSAFKSYFESNCPWKDRPLQTVAPPELPPPPRERAVWTVFSTQCSPFNDWNSLVVVDAHQRLNIAGPIVRLMACNDDSYVPPSSSYKRYRIVRVPDYSTKNGDNFSPRNKGNNLNDWLNKDFGDPNNKPADDDVIVLIDPDQIYVSHLDVSNVRSSHGIAGSYSLQRDFFDMVKEFCDGACDDIGDRLQYLYGPPYVLTAADFKKMLPLWTQLTEQFRAKNETKARFAWLTEMYSYIVAALRHGIAHEKLPLMISNAKDGAEPWALARWNAPIKSPLTFVHFCQRYSLGDLSWYKHSYRFLDVRKCNSSAVFADLTEEAQKVLHKYENQPLDRRNSTQEELDLARSAFLYQYVVPVANRAIKGYYEEFCA